MGSFFFLSGTLLTCHWPIRPMWSCFEKHATVDTCIIVFAKIHHTSWPIRKEIVSWMYSDSNYHNSSYYRYYYHLLWIFDIFLDVSDWQVRQLAYSNLWLAVQLEIQTLKDENGKFMKQNKCKIRKFYFQLLKHHKCILICRKWSYAIGGNMVTRKQE